MIQELFKELRIVIRRAIELFQYITSKKNKQTSIKERRDRYWREQNE